jgi:shikimate kinase
LHDQSQSKNPATGLLPECRMVCLTGFMGSGKSTVGRLLAAQLAWRFVDLDAEIERATGLPISQIFEQKGEAVFRDIEYECLSRVLGSASERDTPMVLALGGGTFAQPRNAALIHGFGLQQCGPGVGPAAGPGVVVVWLDCAMEDLLQRCVLMGDRPLFRDEASFRRLYQERLPYYQQADYRIDSSGDPLRVVEQILALGILGRSAGMLADGNPPERPLP